MQAYNIEIFNRKFENIYHDNLDHVDYSMDYLAPVESHIIVSTDDNISEGQFIRIKRKYQDVFGIITAVEYIEDGMDLAFKPVEAELFDTAILFDTNLQGGSQSLEETIASFIRKEFLENDDAIQNVGCIGAIRTVSRTTGWGFNLKSETEGMHHCIVNFYNTILVRSFEKYGVIVRCIPDFRNRTIDIEIGTISISAMYIESDLPSVLTKDVVIRQTDNSTNKLVIWNDANYTQSLIYYLHPDGTYNTKNQDRMTPVHQNIVSVTVDEGKTFETVAASAAAETFGQIQYNNMIELEVMNDDTLINPLSLVIGQPVYITHNGRAYASIFSGIEVVADLSKLTFGTIRLDLTKLIKTGGI